MTTSLVFSGVQTFWTGPPTRPAVGPLRCRHREVGWLFLQAFLVLAPTQMRGEHPGLCF